MAPEYELETRPRTRNYFHFCRSQRVSFSSGGDHAHRRNSLHSFLLLSEQGGGVVAAVHDEETITRTRTRHDSGIIGVRGSVMAVVTGSFGLELHQRDTLAQHSVPTSDNTSRCLCIVVNEPYIYRPRHRHALRPRQQPPSPFPCPFPSSFTSSSSLSFSFIIYSVFPPRSGARRPPSPLFYFMVQCLCAASPDSNRFDLLSHRDLSKKQRNSRTHSTRPQSTSRLSPA